MAKSFSNKRMGKGSWEPDENGNGTGPWRGLRVTLIVTCNVKVLLVVSADGLS
jgi:hypothetical protein